MKYLVSHQGQSIGPFSVDEIVRQVRGKELELFDYIFDEAKQDWVLLMEFPTLAEQLKSNKPPKPPEASLAATAKTTARAKAPELKAAMTMAPADPHTVSDWHVLKGENKFGPFSYTEIVKMLQQKVVFPFDFIWNSGLDSWRRVVELEDFKPETIRQLHSKSSAGQGVFLERQFQRKEFTGRVLIHDNTTLWKGDGFEISRGGVGLKMSNSLVAPGQKVFVHFKKTKEWPAFNAVCEVVSKKFVHDDSPVQYGLRFLSLSQEVQEEFYKKVA